MQIKLYRTRDGEISSSGYRPPTSLKRGHKRVSRDVASIDAFLLEHEQILQSISNDFDYESSFVSTNVIKTQHTD